MRSLKEIIEEVLSKSPNLKRQELFDAVMAKIRKEGFYTEEELAAIEEELTERLKNY